MAVIDRKPEILTSRLLTTTEVSEYLNVHPNTVRIWSSNGLLRSYRFGPRGNRKFKIEDVEDFLKRNGPVTP